jgi:hypothetical protein
MLSLEFQDKPIIKFTIIEHGKRGLDGVKIAGKSEVLRSYEIVPLNAGSGA